MSIFVNNRQNLYRKKMIKQVYRLFSSPLQSTNSIKFNTFRKLDSFHFVVFLLLYSIFFFHYLWNPVSLVEASTTTTSYFDISKLPNGVNYPNASIFQNIFYLNGTSGNLTQFGIDFATNGYIWNQQFCITDSDGDGLTNGDELGDPCCSWSISNGVLRRSDLSQLSNPADTTSRVALATVKNISNVDGFSATPTFFSVALGWNLTNDTTSVVCYYQIQFSRLNALGYVTEVYMSYTTLNYNMYNLDQNSTYSFRLWPYNFYGIGQPGVVVVKTLEDPYGQGVGDNCSSTVVNWSALFDNWNVTRNFSSNFVTTTNVTTCINDTSTITVSNITYSQNCSETYIRTDCYNITDLVTGNETSYCNTSATSRNDTMLCDNFFNCTACVLNNTSNCTSDPITTVCDNSTYSHGNNDTFQCITTTTFTIIQTCDNIAINSTTTENSTNTICNTTTVTTLTAEDTVIIPSSYTVMLDVSPQPLQHLLIYGCLIFNDQTDLTLQAETIVVTGLLQIGNETNPYSHQATITLNGTVNSYTNIGIGSKNLVVTSGGALSLHGKKHQIAWTLLNKTAAIGDTTIQLTQGTLWDVGDEIVIASTDYDMNQAERRTIVTRIDGYNFVLNRALSYSHYAATEYYTKSDGTIVAFDQRAEVGLLTHNILIQGDDTSDTLMYGGHTVFMQSSQYIRMDNVEFKRMGQAGFLGRYPVHFHMFGNASSSYVTKLSIHDTYQRALVFHGVSNLHAEGIVTYNVFGHAYFLEDAVEEGNIIENCLGIVTKSIPNSRAILVPSNYDSSPATFWMSNPHNSIFNCRAAGSDGHGIWYQLPSYSTGASMSPYVEPNKWYWGYFFNNTVHSNGGYGLNLWYNFYLCTNPALEMFHGIACGSTQNPWAVAAFTKLVAYRNRQQGLFAYVQGEITMTDSIYADNPIGYTFNTINQNNFTVTNCIFIGESNNKGNPNNCYSGCYSCGTGYTNPSSPYYRTYANYMTQPIVGIQFQRDGKNLLLDGVEFFNYVDNCQRRANAIDVKSDGSASMVQGNYQVKNLKFHNSNILYFLVGTTTSVADSYKHMIISDLDGCLSLGANITLPSGFSRVNSRVIPANMIMVNLKKCFYVNIWNAYLCDYTNNWTSLQVNAPAITNSVDSIRFNSTSGYSENLSGYLTYQGTWQYNSVYLDNRVYNYTLQWLGVAGTPEQVNVQWTGVDYMTITLQITQWGPVNVSIVSDNVRYIVSPSNLTNGVNSYDCKKNLVTFNVKSSATLYISDATYIPPWLTCISFNNNLCANISNCGGSTRGKCIGANQCVCRWGWMSYNCLTYHCAHRNWCSGHGSCVGPNVCSCFAGYSGAACDQDDNFSLLSRVLSFGDVHVRTLDNQNYTFNSVGEFYLYKSNEFALQARLQQCVSTSQTSCITQIAFMSGNDTVVITTVGKSRVVMYINGIYTSFSQSVFSQAPAQSGTQFQIPTNLNSFYNEIQYQVDPDTNTIPTLIPAQLGFIYPEQVTVVLNGGATAMEENDTISFVNAGNGTLIPFNIFVIQFTGAFKGQITVKNDGVGFLSLLFAPAIGTNYTGTELGGLYGTMDGNPNNEFTLRNGIVLINPSISDIHTVFGESWRVKSSESLFTYSPPDTYQSINLLTFVPATQYFTSNQTLIDIARRVCLNLGLTGSFLETCLYDVIMTGDAQFALGSASASVLDQCSATTNASCKAVLCLNFCSLHGVCMSGVCECVQDYIGDDCSIYVAPPNIPGIVAGVLVSVFVLCCVLCYSIPISLICYCAVKKRKPPVERMVSIVPTLNKQDDVFEDPHTIHLDDPNYGMLLFKRKQ